MISDIVNPEFNVFLHQQCQQWLPACQTALQQWSQTQQFNLGPLEVLLEKLAQQLMQPILNHLTQALADRTPWRCPKCEGRLLVQVKQRPRSPHSVMGKLTFVRDYGFCPHCQEHFYPADCALGLERQGTATPRVQELAVQMAVIQPYAAAAEAGSHRALGLALSASTCQREARRQGRRARGLLQQDMERSQTPAGVAQLAARSPTARLAPFTLIIQLDAWNIRERDEWGHSDQRRKCGQEVARWHWVYVATVFRLDQRGVTASGRHFISERGYAATRRSLADFQQMVYVEALQRGYLQAEKTLVIADGAVWIWNLAKDRFKDAQQRVDLYHVKAHLHELARVLYGEGTPEARAWLQPLLHYLDRRQAGALDVIASFHALLQKSSGTLTASQVQAVEAEMGYFERHKGRMDYKAAKAAGEPVGSGPIESTCSQYQRRLKCTGQYWSVEGDEDLLALFTLWKNGRLHRLFPHLAPDLNNAAA